MSITKLQRALAVRDAVLPWLRDRGSMKAIGPRDGSLGKVLHGTIDGFNIYLRVPFMGLRVSRPDLT